MCDENILLKKIVIKIPKIFISFPLACLNHVAIFISFLYDNWLCTNSIKTMLFYTKL